MTIRLLPQSHVQYNFEVEQNARGKVDCLSQYATTSLLELNKSG